MTARQTWTVDRLHHVLPHSASRQQLLADVNLTPIEELPAVLERWAAVAESLDAAAGRIETARVSAKVTGELPLDLAADDRTGEVLRDAGTRDARGRGAE
ncbi:hypothetical protein GCM10022244_49640 [Streptomyces gulbargensis]|uniref:Uncharacterized protein n=1 Tax=Streptomyces gulbargensis TaxID=364901 RepID=A0ABP7N2G1_9ACTN